MNFGKNPTATARHQVHRCHNRATPSHTPSAVGPTSSFSPKKFRHPLAYDHIYELSLTGLRFFTVYGPWGRLDMVYFFFTKDILHGKAIDIYQTQGEKEVACDFTYIDKVMKGYLEVLDTTKKSTGSGRKKRGPAQLRIYNLGNTSSVPVEKLVSILEGLLSTKAKKHMIKMPRNGDVPYTHANVTMTFRDFDYKPSMNLATGLRKFTKRCVNYGIKSKVKKETDIGNEHSKESD